MKKSETRELSKKARTTGTRRTVQAMIVVLLIAAGVAMVLTALSLVKTEPAPSEDIKGLLENAVPFDNPTVVPEPKAQQALQTLALGPDTLSAPSIGLQAPVVHWGASSEGKLEIPDSPTVSAFTRSAALGASEGSTLIAGHVNLPDGSGYSPMSSIVKLKAGDLVATTGPTGSREEWKVTGSRIVSRDGLTPDMWQTTGPRQLVLVTCAGELNSNGTRIIFNENLIVTAVPINAADDSFTATGIADNP